MTDTSRDPRLTVQDSPRRSERSLTQVVGLATAKPGQQATAERMHRKKACRPSDETP